MNSLKCFVVVAGLLLGGCSYAERRGTSVAQNTVVDTPQVERAADPSQGLMKQTSLKESTETSQSMVEALDRKIIKTAELKLEVKSPTQVQQQIGSIAETAGGFVVTSEIKQQEGANAATPQFEVSLVLRIPANQFDSALNQIRSTATRVIDDKTSGQDVTEEFIDLEARMKTQKALEAQFLQIMKQANEVSDALEVQRQIAEVRSDIERLEGRKRFLENRTALSTITVNLRTPAVIAVNSSSFGRSVKEAIATSIDLASNIVLALVQLVIVSIPLLVLVVLPAGLLVRFFLRRAKRHQMARELESVPSTN